MRLLQNSILFLVIILTVGCKTNTTKLGNSFSSTDDTLLIRTKKIKGDGLFQLGANSGLNLKKISDTFPYAIKYPKQIKNIERYLFEPDFKEKKHFYVDIIKGTINGQNVFAVDQNNNKDFSDDSIRPFEKMKWDASEKLIKCKYLISNGHEIVKDSSWLKIGTVNDNLFIGRSEHLVGKFQIDHQDFEIGIMEYRNAISFTYGPDSELTLFSGQSEEKKSISKRDLVKIGELLNLNDSFYRFVSISNNGEYVTLVREGHMKNEIGIQVGLIAPSYEVKTTAGDTLENKDLNHKITIIANSCGCGGDKESTQAYYDIKNRFKNINILQIDSNIKTEPTGLHVDIDDKFNKDFYTKYRQQYCSRMCFVIGTDNRVLDKFIITNWKQVLPELLD